MNFIAQASLSEDIAGRFLRAGRSLPNAVVSIGQDLLRDRVLLLLHSKQGRFEARCVEAIERRSLDMSQDGAMRAIGDAIREASYAHAAYWESQVWC